jgi:hypothetical protein
MTVRLLIAFAASVVLAVGCREPQRRSVTPERATIPDADAGANDGASADDDGRPPAALGPEAILLQIDAEPTGPLIMRRDANRRYGRVPLITLYRDGTLVFSSPFERDVRVRDSEQVFMRRLGARSATEIHARALERGTDRLPEWHDWCDPSPKDPEAAIGASDQPNLVFNVRTADRGSATSRVESSCVPAPDDPLLLTQAELSRLAVRSEDAVVYRPERASVYLVPTRHEDGATPWPLSTALFDAAMAREWSLVVLRGRELDRLIDAIGSNNGGAVLIAGDRTLFADVVPWLPGEDHSEAMVRDPLRLP